MVDEAVGVGNWSLVTKPTLCRTNTSKYSIRGLCIKCSTQQSNLSINHLFARTPNSNPALDARLKIKHLEHVLSELGVKRLEVFKCQIVELALTRLSQCHSTPRNVMCLAEWHLGYSVTMLET